MIKKKILDHYEPRVHPEKESFEILDWGSRDEQHLRFKILSDIIRETFGNTDNLSLLDIGCGTADLHAYLEEQEIHLNYTGVDITPAIVEEAQRRRPKTTIIQGDIFSENLFENQRFDISFCSGIFNLNLGNNMAFLEQAAKILKSVTKTLSVTNFLHERTKEKYPHCRYYNTDTVKHLFESTAQSVTVIDNYLEKDFTIKTLYQD